MFTAWFTLTAPSLQSLWKGSGTEMRFAGWDESRSWVGAGAWNNKPGILWRIIRPDPSVLVAGNIIQSVQPRSNIY